VGTDQKDYFQKLNEQKAKRREKIDCAVDFLIKNPEIEPTKELVRAIRGRPKERYLIDGVEFDEREMQLINKKFKRQKDSAPIVMTDEELQAYARSATPALLHRAISLAMGSENIKEIMTVVKEIADRGYGKVAQSVVLSTGKRDIRSTWKSLEGYKPLEMVVEDGVARPVDEDGEMEGEEIGGVNA